jgi:predicted DCC family thiol-disulfide oxidoreductase YuxK
MRRLDRRGAITFIDVAPADALCPLDRGLLLARLHARADGEIVSGAAAFAVMWRAIPMLKSLGLAARNPMVLAALEWMYRGFLRVRPQLQRVLRRWWPFGE